jgi:hypothetical protein
MSIDLDADRAQLRNAHMENLYLWVCCQRDDAAAIAGLEDYALRDLLGWLGRLNVLSGIPGIIYGLALVESSKRFQNS